jgi:membrane-associated phospholipid phosphatase
MKLTKLLTLLMVVTLLLTGCVAPMGSPRVEPEAGSWQTWVVTDLAAVRPPAPPDQAATQQELAELAALAAQRDAQALDQIAYWDAGAPNYRWIEITFAQMQKKPMSNPRLNRLMALLNVAIYDAMVAAWDAKYTYNRPRPSAIDASLMTVIPPSNSPAYPSEQAVAAGAASAILAYIYPDDAQTFQDLAEEAGRSRLLAGVNYPSDVTAGLELGRAVAAQVIERAQSDGADAQWDGAMPAEPGRWTGEQPVEPLMGTWQTWVLQSGSELRPPAPPAYDSAQQQTEMQEIQTYTRTWQSNQKAMFWQTFDGIFTFYYDTASRRIFEHHLDANPPQAARIYALLSVTQYDAIVACWDAKYAYWAMRPFQLDPTLVTLFPTPNHPSYPAAHGCYSGATAAILGHLFPAEAAFIEAKAEEAGMSRMWAGIHFRSDIETGLALGRAVAQMVIEHDQQNNR